MIACYCRVSSARQKTDSQKPEIRRWLDGEIDVDSLVSHRITLDEVNKGFDLMHHQDGIRSVLTFT